MARGTQLNGSYERGEVEPEDLSANSSVPLGARRMMMPTRTIGDEDRGEHHGSFLALAYTDPLGGGFEPNVRLIADAWSRRRLCWTEVEPD